MTGSLINIVLLVLLVTAGVVAVFGPVAVLIVMSWHWHKELAESARVRQARSTQVR